ncbi:glucosyl transferase [Aphanothece hegewaldii CCALA 016]|uniref:Glucosyl transferase n=1 Tax=Aphanothece hegewaldii CCALA 016 TaxID=2107694 RepID=A0A2T1M1W3_9CHRO|nr:glycosyltransferase [Aphanothece hegewaldii]PSF38680.1 glucosyl transferase [Aphanothece hegewaldii CCALA 016]
MLQLTKNIETDSITFPTNPLISVIITNYNYGHFLAQAIESVLHQTYRNFELIVVDDGSTDDSFEVIKNYEESLIAIYQKNAGQGAAFNSGIAKAKGDIICFLDADDYFRKDKLEKVVIAFQKHPEWVQISHSWISVNQDNQVIGRGGKTLNKGNVQNLLLKKGRYAMGITSALAYRRAVLQQVLPVSTKLFQVEGKTFTESADTYLTTTIPFYGKVGCIKEPLMFYRMHGKNVRAHCDQISYLIREHENMAAFINEAANQVGLNKSFKVEKDVDYRSLKAIEQNGVPLTEILNIIRLSLLESIAIKRSLKDATERLLRRSICATFPAQGKIILRLGLRGYLRFKLSQNKR